MTTKASARPGRFRERRKAQGLSQQRLAELAGCSLSFVQLLEAGYEPQESAVLPRIERTLNDVDPAGNGADGHNIAGGSATDAGS